MEEQEGMKTPITMDNNTWWTFLFCLFKGGLYFDVLWFEDFFLSYYIDLIFMILRILITALPVEWNISTLTI